MNLERFGRIVYERRNELGLTQDEVEANGGPTDTTLGKIENGEWTPGNRQITLRKLDAGLEWEAGSAKRTLEGGDPTPLNLLTTPQQQVVEGRNMAPSQLSTTVVMSTQERITLARARHKLLTAAGAITDEERDVLRTFLEEEELRTLHARIDWLPRQEQLLLSSYVNELHLSVEDRLRPDEESPESQPNPLPYQGIAPGDPDPEEKENEHALEIASKSDASRQTQQAQEAGSLDDPESRRLAAETGRRIKSLGDDGGAEKTVEGH